MDDASALENFIFRCIQRYMAGRYTERHGLVSSYDPKTHRVKVLLQPEGFESGWLDIETEHGGYDPDTKKSYGILAGPRVGSADKPGDQVIVRLQEGDFESGKMVARLFSDTDKPPEVQSGEVMLLHVSGATVFLDKNGQTTVTDKEGNSSIVMDGKGNITIKAGSSGTMALNAKTMNLTADNITLKGAVALGDQGGKPLAVQGTLDTAGNADISNLATKVTAV